MRNLRAKQAAFVICKVKITVEHFTFQIKKVVNVTFHLDEITKICLTLKSKFDNQLLGHACVQLKVEL